MRRFEPILLGRMGARGADASRLFDDNEVLIDVANRDLIDEGRRRFVGAVENLDRIAFVQATGVIEPDFAVEFDAARGDELADLRPGLAGEPVTQTGGEGFAGEVGGNAVRLHGHAPFRFCWRRRSISASSSAFSRSARSARSFSSSARFRSSNARSSGVGTYSPVMGS